MIFLTFLTAIALSAVAGYYSVVGLASIFPGSFWPVVLMGGVLEASKLVTVSWLYRNWHRAGWALKSYLSLAVTILMLITSMGIFGYLSKAHLEHSSDTAPLESKVALLTEKIRIEKETIGESRKELKQLDEIVEQTVGRTTDEKGLIQAQALRRTQQKDRGRLVSQIELSQKNIASYQEDLAPLSVEFKKAEADLGPIKYVAALAYGEEAGVGAVEKSVRLVIGLIIIVFDPLAILLLIAGNISLANKHKTTEVKRSKVWDDFMKKQPTELVTEPEPTGFTAEEVASVLPEAVTSEQQAEQYIDRSKLDAMMIKAIQEMHDENHNVRPSYLDQPFKHFENLKPMPAPPTEKPEIYAGNPDDFKEPWPEGKKEELVAAMQDFFDQNKANNTVEVPHDNLIVIDEMGTTIPPIATKYDYGDSYSFREKDKK
jgi:hypothetical protein